MEIQEMPKDEPNQKENGKRTRPSSAAGMAPMKIA